MKTAHGRSQLSSRSERDEDFGEFADALARELWRVAAGDSEARRSPLFAEAGQFFRTVAAQLQEPYFARRSVGLPTAFRFADVVDPGDSNHPGFSAQRNQASEAFIFLADGIDGVIDGTAPAEETRALADLFDRLGEASMRSGSLGSRNDSHRPWSIA